MNKIFETIKFQLIYDNGDIVEKELAPEDNSAGETYLPEISQKWIENNQCPQIGGVEPDQEIVFDKPFPRDGSARVYLSNSFEDGLKLDEWTCQISKFNSFKDHLSRYRHCVTVLYGQTGKTELKSCSLISMLPVPDKPWVQFPEKELARLPDDWCLPLDLANFANGKLDTTTGYRFARFAHETKVRFNKGAHDSLDGINDIVKETTIEAIVDNKGRPYALWLRTPEPIDWRRVKASLRILLVAQSLTCPKKYNHKRAPIDLSMNILPSPDATSAFLIGIKEPIDAGGIRQAIRLPRGEYELKLMFDHQKPDLPALHPRKDMVTPEVITLNFNQLSGEDLPSMRN